MKIFISWSGPRSLGVATALKEWLPYLFNGIDLFVSSEDIRKGKRWPLEVSKELDASNFGIVCLTPDNLEAPWLLFEAGALSKSVKEASVYTLLTGGLRVGDIGGPLSHFQHTVFEKEDFFKLTKAINYAQAEAKQDETRLRRIFDKFWDELETIVSKAAKADSKPEKSRTSEDMLREVLELTTHIARNIPKPQERQSVAAELVPTVAAGGLWKRFLESVGRASPFTKEYLKYAVGGSMSQDGKTFTIVFAEEFEDNAALVNNPRNQELMLKILAELGFKDCHSVVLSVAKAVRQTPPNSKQT